MRVTLKDIFFALVLLISVGVCVSLVKDLRAQWYHHNWVDHPNAIQTTN